MEDVSLITKATIDKAKTNVSVKILYVLQEANIT